MSAIIYLENIAVFICGAFAVAALIWLTKNKPSYVYAALINSALGGLIYIAAIFFGVLKPNIYSSVLSGIFGTFGLIFSLF